MTSSAERGPSAASAVRAPRAPLTFETAPDRYRHWQLSYDGAIATLALNVQEDGGLGDYRLKLNSYDLGVDLELADALQRLRFEHPEVRVVVLRSALDRVFSAGANIYMLAQSSHAFKVNFCKFTNETRLALEDASAHSGMAFLAAVSGTCAGGGYELALACDEIFLVDDGRAAVSLPEVPLLGVLPGTGGVTRLVDKRRVRRDLADVFCTLAEGVKGRRAVAWGLVDAVYPTSRFWSAVDSRARELAMTSARPVDARGIALRPLEPIVTGDVLSYSSVELSIHRAARTAELTIMAPAETEPQTIDDIVDAGDRYWPLRTFRELEDVLLRLRFNEPEIGTIVVRTRGDLARVLSVDATLAAHDRHWLVREIIHFMKRVLKRLEQSARSIVALADAGSCFGGSLFELALAADRCYMLDDEERPVLVALSPMNAGRLPMANGLSRLQARFLATPERVEEMLAQAGPFDAPAALEAGLVTAAPDELDWDAEVRLAIEHRAAMSPDALTGLEASLRFAGPETIETKIFGRLSAWQNWIFQRPNAVGERGALAAYGGGRGRPEFDWRRT
ncbi:MAG: benzoyl-CoA-dihydrodiol lyase [Luteitalea sp.]|nr:benzoyl-CoA-dihydrodiol lyase [Luteitalea sp.]